MLRYYHCECNTADMYMYILIAYRYRLISYFDYLQWILKCECIASCFSLFAIARSTYREYM